MLKPTIALLTTLLSVPASCQEPNRRTAQPKPAPQETIQEAAVPKGHLDYAKYFEAQLLRTSPVIARDPRVYRLGDLITKEGSGFVDYELPIRFSSNKEPLGLKLDFLKAVIHNIEISPIWRLRRATLQRPRGQQDYWVAKELVFGYRRTGSDGKGAFVKLPAGKPAAWQLPQLLLPNEDKQVTLRSILFDMTAKQPTISAQVEVTDKDHRKRFHALETATADACRNAKGDFQDVRWRGDEQPIRGKTGGRFTLDFRLRTK